MLYNFKSIQICSNVAARDYWNAPNTHFIRIEEPWQHARANTDYVVFPVRTIILRYLDIDASTMTRLELVETPPEYSAPYRLLVLQDQQAILLWRFLLDYPCDNLVVSCPTGIGRSLETGKAICDAIGAPMKILKKASAIKSTNETQNRHVYETVLNAYQK